MRRSPSGSFSKSDQYDVTTATNIATCSPSAQHVQNVASVQEYTKLGTVQTPTQTGVQHVTEHTRSQTHAAHSTSKNGNALFRSKDGEWDPLLHGYKTTPGIAMECRKAA